MRPQGSPAELERRRLRAIDLLQRDLPVHIVAERLGVDRRSVRRWKRAYRGDGRAGLRARPASGRPPKLTATQRRQLVRAVVAGPEAAGYRTSLWTCRRIVDVIRHHCGRVASVRSGLSHARRSAMIAVCASGFGGTGPG